MPFPTLSFTNIDSWFNWVNNNIIPNGMELITGDDGNITENAAIYFIKRSPLNWQTAKVESTGGSLIASRPITVFTSIVPTSLSWVDNIYNQYIFINTINSDIPLLLGSNYYDIDSNLKTVIPAKSIVNIVKTSNNSWIVGSVLSSGSNIILPPYIGVVDRGNPNDPVSGQSTFQNDSLKGLGASNDDEIQINYAEQIRSSFGVNKSFNYDSLTGTIDLNYNSSGEEFYPGSSLWIDRNQ